MSTSSLTLPVAAVALATRLSAQADTAAMMLSLHRDSIPANVRTDFESLIASAETLAAQVTTAEAYRALGEEIDAAERTVRGSMGRGLGGMTLIAEMRARQAALDPNTATHAAIAAERSAVRTQRYGSVYA